MTQSKWLVGFAVMLVACTDDPGLPLQTEYRVQGTVTGTVFYADSTAAPGGSVVVRIGLDECVEGRENRFTTTTDEDGVYTLSYNGFATPNGCAIVGALPPEDGSGVASPWSALTILQTDLAAFDQIDLYLAPDTGGSAGPSTSPGG